MVKKQNKECNKEIKEHKREISALKRELLKLTKSTEDLTEKSEIGKYYKKEKNKLEKGMNECMSKVEKMEGRVEKMKIDNKELERLNEKLLDSKCGKVYAQLYEKLKRVKEENEELVKVIDKQRVDLKKVSKLVPGDQMRRIILLKEDNKKLRLRELKKNRDFFERE